MTQILNSDGEITSRLGLGTAQFGSDYGISNRVGMPSITTVERLLSLAHRSGIRVLDTAPNYGSSEWILGCCGAGKRGFRLISKLSRLPGRSVGKREALDLTEKLRMSLENLQINRLDGLLFHHPRDALKPGGDRLFEALRKEKEAGRICKIGVSVYTPEELEAILIRFEIDLVQLPLNILDQRFLTSGLIGRLNCRGIEVHVRSVFLQGILLMEPTTVPDYFRPILDRLHAIHDYAREMGLSPLKLVLRFVLAQEGIEACLVGVNRMSELREVIEVEQAKGGSKDWSSMAIDDPAYVIPSNWQV